MKRLLTAVILTASMPPATTVAAPAGYFDFGMGVTFETGDTWVSGGRRYRLYGLQSCLRGTTYKDRLGAKRDCGEASIAVLSALVKDTRPVCAPVVEQGDLTFVACFAAIGGQRLDLGMMMITEGYGFASLNSASMPIHPAYAVAEQKARQEKRGLWQFNDVQHPAILLGNAAKNGGASR